MKRERSSQIIPVIKGMLALYGLSLLHFSHFRIEGGKQEVKCRCEMCGKRFKTKKLYAHHILPVRFGGSDAEENMAILCKECHRLADRATESGNLFVFGEIENVVTRHPMLIRDQSLYNLAVRSLRRFKVNN